MNQIEFNKTLLNEFRKTNPDGKNCAKRALDLYFGTKGDRYTGSQFEALSDSANPNQFTAKDLLSVNCLSVDIPIRASLWLLAEEGQSAINPLLSQVPQDLEIWSVEAERALGPSGPMIEIWKLLKTANWPNPRGGNGLGGLTKRSKLLAAKRPHLVPILDRVIQDIFPSIENYWSAFRTALQDNEIRAEIQEITENAPAHLSLLRKIDAALWTSHTRNLQDEIWP